MTKAYIILRVVPKCHFSYWMMEEQVSVTSSSGFIKRCWAWI